MVFPYMDHDLAGLLENERVKLQPSHIKLYMKQLLEGTEYMHRVSHDSSSFDLWLNIPWFRITFYIVIWKPPIYLFRTMDLWKLQILACLGRMTRTSQILVKVDTEAKNANTLIALLRGGIVPLNFWWALDSMAERLTSGALGLLSVSLYLMQTLNRCFQLCARGNVYSETNLTRYFWSWSTRKNLESLRYT